jgi:hypothetical protein
MAILTPQEVREYIYDKVEKNYLVDGEELSDTQINIAMELTLSEWNSTPPTAADNLANFKYKHILMSGTLYRCFMGLSALLARNTFAFTDGGLSIPLEERFQLYQTLSGMFQGDFYSTMAKTKININMDEGWGSLGSDYSNFPLW